MPSAVRGLIARFLLGAAVSAALPFLPLAFRSADAAAPVASGGTLDLRTWNFDAGGTVPLRGEWGFVPGALLDGSAFRESFPTETRTVPDRWSGAGAGTYLLRVLLPEGAGDLALSWTTAATAFAAYADGVPVAAAGKTALAADDAVPAYRPGAAALPAPSTGGELLIAIAVSNHEYRVGGMWRPFLLGSRRAVLDAKRAAELASLVSLGILLGLSVPQLAVFLFRPATSPSWFLFLFTMAVALRSLVTGEYLLVSFFPGIGFGALIRLEYFSAYLIVPLAAHFFGKLFSGRMPVPVLAASVPFLAAVPFAPLPLLTRTITWYYPVAAFSLAYIAATSAAAAVRSRSVGALPLLAGAFAILSASINDLLYASFRVRTGNLLPFALVFFCALMTVSLSRRYVLAFSQIERLLAEKDTYLKEMHHRVKNSLQIVASVMTLQTNRVEDPAVKGLFRSMRERVRSVSLVHEKLHSSLSGEDVDVAEYVRDLVGQIAASYGDSGPDSRPLIEFSGETGRAPIEFCVDLGLALTEALINAYKHAGAPTSVSFRRVGLNVGISVLDDGPGFPPGFAIEGRDSLGFKILSSVVRRRGGTIEFGGGPGGRIVFTMPLPVPKAIKK